MHILLMWMYDVVIVCAGFTVQIASHQLPVTPNDANAKAASTVPQLPPTNPSH
jgi:hypothetical protein